MFLDFLKMLGMILGIVWTLLVSLLYFLPKPTLFKEILIGCLLPVVCFVPGFYAVSWAVNRPFRPFLLAVFGGMLARLLFIGTAFLLIATLTKLHMSSVLFSLVGFYTLCLAVELYFINKSPHNREEM
jgi:Ca2+/H+ antiporter